MKIKELAERLGISQQTLRVGLQQGVYPFGIAYKNKSKYVYVLYPEKVREYIGKE